jgi:hypothetical protein
MRRDVQLEKWWSPVVGVGVRYEMLDIGVGYEIVDISWG